MEYDKNNKHQTVVKNEIIVEEITLKGKQILRERIIKVFNIPKIINSDIGFQLQFGSKSNDKPYSQKSNQNIVCFDANKNLGV